MAQKRSKPGGKIAQRATFPKIGDIVSVEFLDHAEDTGEALRFCVYGIVHAKTRETLGVTSWHAVGQEDTDNECNEKRWAIVRKAICRVRILCPTN